MAVAHRIYARALFEAAQEDGRLERVAEEVSALARAAEEVPQLQAFLRNPEVDTPAKAEVLVDLAAGADELVRNFLRLLVEKGRAGELVDVERELAVLVARAQGRLAVELETAIELSDDEASAIVRQIEQASGRKVEATRRVDPSLIGGVVLQVGSFRADGSVRGRLERLGRDLVTSQ